MPSPTVLIVDDDLDWLQIVSRFLEAHAFHVVTATNGTEALRALESAPQLKAILLDLHMPIMSGLEFYRRVRRDRRFRKVPVYLVTADRRGDSRARRFIAGYLRKPLDLNAL